MRSLEGVDECKKWLDPNERVSWELDEDSLKIAWVLQIYLNGGWEEVARILCNDDRATPRMIVEDLKRVRIYYEGNKE